MTDPPFGEVAFMNERARRVRTEVGIPVDTSWNLGVPQNADRVIGWPEVAPQPEEFAENRKRA